MKKNLLTIISILILTQTSSAVDLSQCSKDIQKEVQSVSSQISKLDDLDKYSDEMLAVLDHSVTGIVLTAPDCESLKNIEQFYKTAIKDLK